MMEVIELLNLVKIRILGEKETYKYLEIFKTDTIKQVQMKGIIFKRVNYFKKRKLKIKQYKLEFHQSDKHLCCFPQNANPAETIPERYKGRTLTKESEKRKFMTIY